MKKFFAISIVLLSGFLPLFSQGAGQNALLISPADLRIEKVEGGKVYVIEGNTNNNKVENRSYALNHKNIYGYAVPSYQ